MADHPTERAPRTESGLTDDDFAPVWAGDDRPRIPRVAGEREALTAYLDHYRATVEMKCRGLTPEQARTRSMPPSTMSLHGLVRHLASVERGGSSRTTNAATCPSSSSTAATPI